MHKIINYDYDYIIRNLYQAEHHNQPDLWIFVHTYMYVNVCTTLPLDCHQQPLNTVVFSVIHAWLHE